MFIEKPARKRARLREYDYSSAGYYFVTICTKDRQESLGSIVGDGLWTSRTPIWQRSYYDHIIRNEAEYKRIWKYINDNPLLWEKDTYYIKNEVNHEPVFFPH